MGFMLVHSLKSDSRFHMVCLQKLQDSFVCVLVVLVS